MPIILTTQNPIKVNGSRTHSALVEHGLIKTRHKCHWTGTWKISGNGSRRAVFFTLFTPHLKRRECLGTRFPSYKKSHFWGAFLQSISEGHPWDVAHKWMHTSLCPHEEEHPRQGCLAAPWQWVRSEHQQRRIRSLPKLCDIPSRKIKARNDKQTVRNIKEEQEMSL